MIEQKELQEMQKRRRIRSSLKKETERSVIKSEINITSPTFSIAIS